jgi:K+-transporting ATPase KdpF subunit
MNALSLGGLIVAIAMIGYLVYVMLRPERF